jgi:hypothetical protein
VTHTAAGESGEEEKNEKKSEVKQGQRPSVVVRAPQQPEAADAAAQFLHYMSQFRSDLRKRRQLDTQIKAEIEAICSLCLAAVHSSALPQVKGRGLSLSGPAAAAAGSTIVESAGVAPATPPPQALMSGRRDSTSPRALASTPEGRPLSGRAPPATQTQDVELGAVTIHI